MPSRKSITSSDIADHEELVSEIPQIERMATAERLKLAKKRRQKQLKSFSHYEKQVDPLLNF